MALNEINDIASYCAGVSEERFKTKSFIPYDLEYW